MSLAIKWWLLGAILALAFAMAIPDYLVDKNFDKTFALAPIIMLYSLLNLIRANRSLSDFINNNTINEEQSSKKNKMKRLIRK